MKKMIPVPQFCLCAAFSVVGGAGLCRGYQRHFGLEGMLNLDFPKSKSLRLGTFPDRRNGLRTERIAFFIHPMTACSECKSKCAMPLS